MSSSSIQADEVSGWLTVIAQHPEDLSVNRAFADWLEQKGDAEWAAFVRGQLRYPTEHFNQRKFTVAPEIDRRTAARLRRQPWLNFLRDVDDQWEPKAIGFLGQGGIDFRCGVPYGLSLSLADYHRFSKKLFQVAPTITALTLNAPEGCQEELDRLVSDPLLSRLTYLAIDVGANVADLTRLLTTGQLDRLQTLRMQAPLFGLRICRSECEYVSDPAIDQQLKIFSSPRFKRLKKLAIHSPSYENRRAGECGISERRHFGDEVCRAIATSSTLLNLESLDIEATSANGVASLGDSPVVSNLKELFVSIEDESDGAGDALMTAIGNASRFGNLRNLDVRRVRSPMQRGLSALADSPYLKKLRRLTFAGGQFGPTEFVMLVQSANLSQLEYLYCCGCGVHDAAMEAFAKSPFLSRLEHVVLCHNRVSERVVEILRKSKTLQQLKSVNLAGADWFDYSEVLESRNAAGARYQIYQSC